MKKNSPGCGCCSTSIDVVVAARQDALIKCYTLSGTSTVVEKWELDLGAFGQYVTSVSYAPTFSLEGIAHTGNRYFNLDLGTGGTTPLATIGPSMPSAPTASSNPVIGHEYEGVAMTGLQQPGGVNKLYEIYPDGSSGELIITAGGVPRWPGANVNGTNYFTANGAMARLSGTTIINGTDTGGRNYYTIAYNDVLYVALPGPGGLGLSLYTMNSSLSPAGRTLLADYAGVVGVLWGFQSTNGFIYTLTATAIGASTQIKQIWRYSVSGGSMSLLWNGNWVIDGTFFPEPSGCVIVP